MIEQKDSEILELAGFADRNRKAREVYSEPIFVQVNSKLAAYTIPGMRSEGTTYDVPTYSALKGAMDSIYKHVGMEAIPTAVYIHSPIKKTRILLRNIENIEGMRSRECLTDVCYTVVVRIVRMDNMALESDLTVQYRNFLEYASDSCGMGYPYLGVMETPMYFHPVTEAEIIPTLPITSDLCNMPLTPDYTNKISYCNNSTDDPDFNLEIIMSPHHRELFNAYFKEQFKAVYHMSVEEAWAKFGTE